MKWYDGYGPKGKGLEFNYNVFQAQSDGSNILVGSRVDFVPVPTFAEKVQNFFTPTKEGEKGGIKWVSSNRQPGSDNSYNAPTTDPGRPENIDWLLDAVSMSITAGGDPMKIPKNIKDVENISLIFKNTLYQKGALDYLGKVYNKYFPEKKIDSVTCPTCSQYQDSGHVDFYNSPGTFKSILNDQKKANENNN